MRVIATLIVGIMLLPTIVAISDLTIYSEAKYSSQDTAPVLVEFFHGPDDDEIVDDLNEMEDRGDITLLHWRTGADEEGGGLPKDDANSRLMYHGLNSTPSVAIDGFKENISDVKPLIKQNEVEIDWTIQLIGSSKVELLNITATWTNPQTLNGATQLHIFIIESEAIDKKGRTVKNLVRDWSPSSTFHFSNNTTNNWNETITYDHLEGAGIELGDASHADDFEVILVMVGGFENETTNRVLSLQRAKMPTYWQSVDDGAVFAPAVLLLGAIIVIGFIVQAERKRELGLPRLEGSWSDEENVIDYKIIAKYGLQIGDLSVSDGWKINGRIKKETMMANTTKSGKLKVSGSGEFKLKLSVKVDNLGDWILDLNLPVEESND